MKWVWTFKERSVFKQNKNKLFLNTLLPKIKCEFLRNDQRFDLKYKVKFLGTIDFLSQIVGII